MKNQKQIVKMTPVYFEFRVRNNILDNLVIQEFQQFRLRFIQPETIERREEMLESSWLDWSKKNFEIGNNEDESLRNMATNLKNAIKSNQRNQLNERKPRAATQKVKLFEYDDKTVLEVKLQDFKTRYKPQTREFNRIDKLRNKTKNIFERSQKEIRIELKRF